MKSIGVTLQRTYLTKKLQKETLCDIQLSSPIFLILLTIYSILHTLSKLHMLLVGNFQSFDTEMCYISD